MDELILVLGNHRTYPDILGLCETFLTPDITDGHIMIEDYDLIRKDRTVTYDKIGGGQSFMLKKK